MSFTTQDAGPSQDMGALLDSMEEAKPLRRGDLVEGVVMSVDANGIFVNVGHKVEGVVPAGEMRTLKPEDLAGIGVGDEIVTLVVRTQTADQGPILSVDKAAGEHGWRVLQKALESGENIQGTILGFNRGGAIVEAEGVQGFVPMSQLVSVSREHFRSTEERPPESTDERPPESTDERPPESTDERPPESTDERPPESTDERPPESTDERPPESTDERPPEPTDERPPEPTDERPPEPTDERPPEPTDERPPEPTDERPPEPTDERPPEPTDERPPEPTDERPPEPTDERPPEPTEEREDEPPEVHTPGPTDDIGKVLELKVLEVTRGRNRAIFSERRALQQRRDEQKARLIQELTEGEVRRGRVTGISSFGAFVDLGGADGLIHISELAWNPVNSPEDVVKVGEELDVYVLRVDAENTKIALSLKRLHPEPWDTLEERHNAGDIVEATVTKLTNFGAFARVEGSIEGLIHISELTSRMISHPREVVQEGDSVTVKILRIEAERRRLGLSLKQAVEEFD